MQRPMLRIVEPLRLMGANITLSSENTAPIEIIGDQSFKGIDYELLIPSAQVKSGILLASLYAQEDTHVREKIRTRDHTEKMLATLSKYIDLRHQVVTKHSGHLFSSQMNTTPRMTRLSQHPRARWMHVARQPTMMLKIPGDISSAAFFIVATAITPNSQLIIRDVGINPLRTGVIAILKLMGAHIEMINERWLGTEPVADIVVCYAPLRGITIPAELISTAIDEFPVIFIAAVTASGNTILRGASELRVKESDRIAVMCEGLHTLGVIIEEYDDGVMIAGDQVFQGGRVNAHNDHRVAMAFAVAGGIARHEVIIDNADLVKTSFPNFVELAKLSGMNICLQFQ